MTPTQITTAVSGAPAEPGQSGVFSGQGKKGGVFTGLMKALQHHLKTGADQGGAVAQGKSAKVDILASLLKGKHGAEIAALLAKLGQGAGKLDSKALAGLSPQALAALKQALLLLQSATNLPSGDGKVDIVAQIKAALKAIPAGKGDLPQSDKKGHAAKVENGSSLEVALVALGVQVTQTPTHHGGASKTKGETAAELLAADLAGKGKSKNGKIAMGAQDKKATTAQANADKANAAPVNAAPVNAGKGTTTAPVNAGKATTVQASVDQSTTIQTNTGKSTTAQANTDKATTAQSTTDKATTVQTSVDQSATIQSTAGKSATIQANTGKTTTVQATTAQATPNSGEILATSHDPRGQGNVVAGDATQAVNPAGQQKVATGGDSSQGDDGIAASLLKQGAAMATNNAAHADSTASSSRLAQQAVLHAQSSQQHAGDNHQKGNNSSQNNFDGLINTLHQDQATATKGAGFAAQMGSYRAHPSWSPAEAMMKLGKAAADGSMRLELQLEPAHLGKIHVSIQSDANKQVQMHITVDNVAGRTALDQNMGQLRSALAQQGLDLGSFSMDLSSQGQQGQQNSSGSRFSKNEDTTFTLQTDEIQVERHGTIETGHNRAATGRLSILA
ncbi:MAG: flagellar hook-length control protein FliK [Mariprofundales bacterium]|nr:flagellar hook-length control protein FliK [Mariprofundales bacterium]